MLFYIAFVKLIKNKSMKIQILILLSLCFGCIGCSQTQNEDTINIDSKDIKNHILSLFIFKI